MSGRSTHCWFLLIASTLVACGEDPPGTVPISHADAALTAQENTERALRALLDSGSFLADSAAIAGSLSSLSPSTESCSGSYVTPVCPADTPNCDTTPVYQETCTTEPNDVTVDDLAQNRQDLYNALDELVQTLRDKVFTEENLESEDGTQVTYLLGSDVLCGDSTDTTVDTTCVEDAAKMQLRLRLTSPREGDVDVGILLSEQKRNPVTLELHQDRLGVVLDLGELKATLDAVEAPVEGLSQLDGKLSAELVKNADLDVSLRFNVLEQLTVVAGDAGEEVTVGLAPSSPTAELRLDGNARKVTGTYDFGAFNLTMPLGAFFSDDEENYDDLGNPIAPKTYTGLIKVLLGGLNGQLTLDGSSDVLGFTGLGLGDVSTTVHHDENLLFQLDINQDQGRRFDLQIQGNPDASPTLTFSPTLDVRLLLGFQHLVDQVPDIDALLLNDTLRFWFDGSDPSLQAGQGQVRVVSGTLHLDSQTAPQSSVSVPAGMCLLEAPETTEAPASIPASFVSGACQ